MDNYLELMHTLETEEFQDKNPGAELYVKLMAIYLYHNELYNAKYLWKRIPSAIIAENKELERLHSLLRSLICKNFTEFFKTINYSWPDSISTIMEDILQKTRKKVLFLISKAYTSIFEQQLLQLMQMRPEQLKATCIDLGWTYEGGCQDILVLPKSSINPPEPKASSEDQLFKLTEFVSFLEN